MMTANIPTVLEQRLLGTPITYESKLSRRELQTLFYVGRKLELVACYMPMAAPDPRTVTAHRSFGYIMTKPDGRMSRLDFESGQKIVGVSCGNGYSEVKIVDVDGRVAAHYRLL